MAELLVELVKLTPIGFNELREHDPDEALRLLAEGDELVQPFIAQARTTRHRCGTSADGRLQRPRTDRRSSARFDCARAGG